MDQACQADGSEQSFGSLAAETSLRVDGLGSPLPSHPAVDNQPSEGVDVFVELALDVLDGAGHSPILRKKVMEAISSVELRADLGFAAVRIHEIKESIDTYLDAVREGVGGRRGPRGEAVIIDRLRNDLGILSSRIRPTSLLSKVQRNAGLLAELFELSPAEERLVVLVGMARSFYHIDHLLTGMLKDLSVRNMALAALLRTGSDEVDRIVAGNTSICRSGVLVIYDDPDGFTDQFEMRPELRFRLTADHDSADDMIRSLLKASQPSRLAPDDVAHLSSHLDHCARMLAHAREQGTRGVNILLYGPPGTGKTEMAKLMAERAGLRAYMVGEVGFEQDLSRDERIAALCMTETLIARDSGSLAIFDEMEDLTVFQTGEGSKIMLNRLLDENRSPIVWIANDRNALQDHLVRRMIYAIEVPVPPPEVQRRILTKIAEQEGIPLSTSDVAALQKAADVVPAVARNAAVSARLAGAAAGDFQRAYLQLNSVLTRRRVEMGTEADHVPYRPEFAVTDSSLEDFASRLAGRGALRVSFAFYGPAGTGKSAGARFLCDAMGVKSIEKRGSDILGSYVGETERAIRKVFEEARDEKAALIFDEIDSLLSSREGHKQSWETSQVNELLVALERHPAPVFGCTNLIDTLDKASLRRFLFRVKFDTLPADKAAACFAHYIGADAPAGLAQIEGLVPSDFSLVKRRCDILGITDLAEMLEMLRKEAASRGDKSRPIGFRRPVH